MHTNKIKTCVCIVGVLFAHLPASAWGTSLDVVQSLNNLWTDVTLSAAEETLKAIQAKAGIDLSLRDVPLDSLQVLIASQHQLGIEVDGVNYEVVLNSDIDSPKNHQALPNLHQGNALHLPPSSLPPQEWWRMRDHSVQLPEITLAGPLELFLLSPQPVSVFTPLAADVGLVRHVVLADGVSVRVAGIKGITLRRPVQLPNLPGQYLAEVYAQHALGKPEEGYEFAPGISYLSQLLHQAARNASENQKGNKHVLSFEVEPLLVAPMSISSVALYDGDVAPRLKVKKLPLNYGIELSLRPSSPQPPQPSTSPAPTLPPIQWAWPLPHTDITHWVKYETLLRGILAAHPFNFQSVLSRGIALKLTKSSIKGVRLLKFEIEARKMQGGGMGLDVGKGRDGEEGEEISVWEQVQREETPLEVWEALVEIHPRDDVDDHVASHRGGKSVWNGKLGSSHGFRTGALHKEHENGVVGGVVFKPLTVRRKHVYGSTLTVSERFWDLVSGGGRWDGESFGNDVMDLGVARNA